jgi:predicted MFS family arabinose efflux permease
MSIPAIITSRSPCLAILLLSTFYNGLINVILSSLGSVSQSQFGFSPKTAGLVYLGLGVADVIAVAATPRPSDFLYKSRIQRNGSKGPEHTLLMIVIAGPFTFFTFIGLVWYGWSTEYRLS